MVPHAADSLVSGALAIMVLLVTFGQLFRVTLCPRKSSSCTTSSGRRQVWLIILWAKLLTSQVMAMEAPTPDGISAQHLGGRFAESQRRFTSANHALPTAPGLSFLESSAVRSAMQRHFLTRMIAFADLCSTQGGAWPTDLSLHHWLVVLFDEMFFRGSPAGNKSKAVAAIKHFIPEV